MSFLRSKTLALWLIGLFIIYYMTVAVWSKEAFIQFMVHLSSGVVFRVLYVLFVVNAALRIIGRVKGRALPVYALLLRLPLYAGLLLFLVSFFLSVNGRKTMWHDPVGPGDIVTVPWSGERFQVAAVKSAFEKNGLRMDDSPVFDYEPAVSLMDQYGTVHEISAFPPVRVGSLYLHVLQFGISPGMALKEKGRVAASQYIPLRLTPFGTPDTFHIEPLPYTFSLAIVPNRTVRKGQEMGRKYELAKPRYRVEIMKSGKVITKVETDSGFSIDAERSISFLFPSEWVLLEIVSDPFLPFFAAGLCLLLTGIVLYPFSYLALCAKGARS